MNKVKQQETAGIGVESQARGPFIEPKYKQAITILEENPDEAESIFLSTAFQTQYNIGGKIEELPSFLSARM